MPVPLSFMAVKIDSFQLYLASSFTKLTNEERVSSRLKDDVGEQNCVIPSVKKINNTKLKAWWDLTGIHDKVLR